MKKLLLLFGVLMIAVVGFAQDELEGPDEIETLTNSSRDARDRVIFEFNWDYLLDTPDSLNIQGKSRGFNVFFYWDMPLGSENFAFAPGLGVSIPNYFHNSNLYADTSGITQIAQFPDSVDVSKNKLSLTYFEIPLELRFRTNRNSKGNRFKVAVGFKAGIVMSSHSKYVGEEFRPGVYTESGDVVKFKEHRIRNIEQFRYGPTLRVGYGNINIQAYYGLANLFTEDGPTGTPLSVGISFNPF